MVRRLLCCALALLLLVGGVSGLYGPLADWLTAAATGADLDLPRNAATLALDGQLLVEHGHARDGRGFTNYRLLTEDSDVPLRLPQSIVAGRPSGMVSLLGRARSDGTVVVDQLRVLQAALPAVSTGAQRTAVILLAVKGATNPYSTFPNITAQMIYGQNAGSANTFYHNASYGQTQIVPGSHDTTPDGSGSIFGPYTVDSVPSCGAAPITAQALQAAGSAISPADFDRILVSLTFPNTTCGFGGISAIYPMQVTTGLNFPTPWLNSWVSFSAVQSGFGPTPATTPNPTFTGQIGNTVIHEYGHQLGMYHANTLECGAVAVLGNACASIEYGDKSDVMGNTDGQPGPVNKDVLGWLQPSLVQEVTSSGTYVISGYESLPTATPTLSGPPGLTPSPTPLGNTRALKVPRTRDANGVITSHYYLILRQPQTFRTYLTPFPLYNQGVLVYTQGTAAMCTQASTLTTTVLPTVTATRTPTAGPSATPTPTGSATPAITATRTACDGSDPMFLGAGGGGDSLLINANATPGTANNFTVAPLLRGQTYTDTAAGVQFRVVDVDQTIGRATVQVTFTGPPLVQIQPIIYPGIVLPTATPGGPSVTPQVILPGSFSGGGAYAAGTMVTLNVVPGPSYKFAYWRENRTALPTSVAAQQLVFPASGDRVLEAVLGPSNDSLASALQVTAVPTQAVVNNESSTNRSNPSSCTSPGGTLTTATINHGVWYRIGPGPAQTYTANTQGTSDFVGQTILAVWTQSGAGATPSLVTCATNGQASSVSWSATANTAYYVQAGLLDSGLGGLLVLNFALGTPSPTPTPTVTATPTQLSRGDAIEHVRRVHGRTGQQGVRAASRVGDTASVSGPGVSGSGRVTNSMSWTLSATVPAGVAPGTIAHAVLSTDLDLDAFPCTPVVAGSPTVTCSGTTVGNALQSSLVVVVFAPGVTAIGTVTGAAVAPTAVVVAVPPPPLLPPPPPIIAPPPPLPIPPPAMLPAAPFIAPPDAAAVAGVPVIPEADVAWLLLAALAGLAVWTRGRRPRA